MLATGKVPNDLRALRKQLGLTQAELAARLGISRKAVCENERGKTPTPRERILATLYLTVQLSAVTDEPPPS